MLTYRRSNVPIACNPFFHKHLLIQAPVSAGGYCVFGIDQCSVREQAFYDNEHVTLLSGYKSNKISWLETSAKSDWELSL